ncbi:ABC transporter ATP-binding protein [Sinanaerobacter chloroacetimidivorans]|jgi:putative ABC transport system ATP-binding protein|uniref:ABC transporter ATP-binding protein n=1 Tax=Sinanaerobacter chloroacetimidivorans TaxID=2818044 RepID=A0A8J8B1J0_9FIRM|nr:ABC transporter ATP-binding protein [Sinanaerobacter chloroacetimidivorans]MBR0598299.1 ABC transporter ATP-binding protein [Sinanaerobacter chloroacetimidivorans]
MFVLRAENLSKSYQMGEIEVKALLNASFEIEEGEFVVILGPSGSGKSTLLNIIGGMDQPSSGRFYMMEEEITEYDERKLTEYRRNKVGFVFQFYNIMANLTAEENVELATEISEDPLPIDEILEAVGLADRKDHFPAQMSGGEQQRVSIARAVAKNPAILLCDEPTGALDFNTGIAILSLLRKVNKEMGKTILVITHNSDIAYMADRVIKMRSGQITKNYINENPMAVEEIKW